MNKIKILIKIILIILVLFVISVSIFEGHNYFTKRSLQTDVMEFDISKNNFSDILAKFNPNDKKEIYMSNYNLIKKMVNRGGVAIIKVEIDKDPKLMLFQTPNLKLIESFNAFYQTLILENLNDLNTYYNLCVEKNPTENIFFGQDKSKFWTSLANARLQAVELKRCLSRFLGFTKKIEEGKAFLYSFIHERRLKFALLEKTAQNDEYEFRGAFEYPIQSCVEGENILTFILCNFFHPNKFEARGWGINRFSFSKNLLKFF